MKTKSVFILPFLFILFGFSEDFDHKKIEKKFYDQSITGIYQGLNENFEFVFKTDNGTIVTFQETVDNVPIDLFDDASIGKKYEITWTELTINITDDEGEPTGEKSNIKRITSIKSL
jgi:hypothetical protein